MVDLYNKPDKAGRKQQIYSRLTLLGAQLRRNAVERTDIEHDIETLRAELVEIQERGDNNA